MAESLGSAVLELTANTAPLNAAMTEAEAKTKTKSASMASSMKSIGKAGMVAFGAFALIAGVGYETFTKQQNAIAQISVALKSTGDASRMTVGGIKGLAESLSNLSGKTQAEILSGESTLLLFPKIRNEMGKGNDIYTQAIKLATDMSVRLGKDLPASAKMLGKALQDPVKGLTAMGRLGITFTDSQKKMIKSMVDSGHQMQAQKYILAQLETRFGGAAKAAGQTLTGQLHRAKNSLEEVAASIFKMLLPAFTKFASILQSVSGFLQKHTTLAKVLLGILGGVGAIMMVVSTGFKLYTTYTKLAAAATALFTTTQEGEDAALMANPITIIITALIALGAALAIAYEKSATFRAIVWDALHGVEDAAKEFWNVCMEVFDWIKNNWQLLATIIAAPLAPFVALGAAIYEFRDAIANGFQGVWDGVTQATTAFCDFFTKTLPAAFDTAFGFIKTGVNAFCDFFTKTLPAAFQSVITWLGNNWPAIATILSGPLAPIVALATNAFGLRDALVSAFGDASTWLSQAGAAIIGGLDSAMQTAWTAISNWLTSRPSAISGFFANAIGWLTSAGGKLISGFWSAEKQGWSDIAHWFGNIPGWIKDFFTNAGDWLKDAGGKLISGFWSAEKTGWQMIVHWFEDLPGKIKGFFDGAIHWLESAGGKVISGFWSAEKTGWQMIINWFEGLPGKIKGFFKDAIHWLEGAGEDIISGLEKGIKSGATDLANIIKAPVNAIIRAWNGLDLKIPGFSIDTHIPGVGKIGWGGYDVKTPQIPLLDAGGIVTEPTLAMLAANRQPEAVVPLSQGALAGAGGDTIHVHVAGSILSERELWEIVRRHGTMAQTRLGPGVNMFSK